MPPTSQKTNNHRRHMTFIPLIIKDKKNPDRSQEENTLSMENKNKNYICLLLKTKHKQEENGMKYLRYWEKNNTSLEFCTLWNYSLRMKEMYFQTNKNWEDLSVDVPFKNVKSCYSQAHRKFTHILDHKTYHNKFKRREIIQCLLSDNNGIKLEVNNRKMTGNSKYVEI